MVFGYCSSFVSGVYVGFYVLVSGGDEMAPVMVTGFGQCWSDLDETWRFVALVKAVVVTQLAAVGAPCGQSIVQKWFLVPYSFCTGVYVCARWFLWSRWPNGSGLSCQVRPILVRFGQNLAGP